MIYRDSLENVAGCVLNFSWSVHRGVVLFAFVDVGCQGRISDGGIFKNCEMYEKIDKEP